MTSDSAAHGKAGKGLADKEGRGGCTGIVANLGIVGVAKVLWRGGWITVREQCCESPRCWLSARRLRDRLTLRGGGEREIERERAGRHARRASTWPLIHTLI
jgi:hypothetical protein